MQPVGDRQTAVWIFVLTPAVRIASTRDGVKARLKASIGGCVHRLMVASRASFRLPITSDLQELFRASSRVATFGLFFAVVPLSMAKTPPRYAGERPV